MVFKNGIKRYKPLLVVAHVQYICKNKTSSSKRISTHWCVFSRTAAAGSKNHGNSADKARVCVCIIITFQTFHQKIWYTNLDPYLGELQMY